MCSVTCVCFLLAFPKSSSEHVSFHPILTAEIACVLQSVTMRFLHFATFTRLC